MGAPCNVRTGLSFVRSKSPLLFTDYVQVDTHKMCLTQNMKSNQTVRGEGGACSRIDYCSLKPIVV